MLFHDAVAQRLGLRLVDHKALDLIARKGPLTAGALAQETGLTPGAVTGLVDRLERAGYVRRRPDPTDRRRRLLSAVVDQDPVLVEVFTGLSKDMDALFNSYDEQEKVAIADYITRAAEVLRIHTPAGELR